MIGIILSAVGAATDHVQFAYSWFFAFYYFFTIGARFVLLGSRSITPAIPTGRSWRAAPGKISWALFPVLLLLFIPLLWPISATCSGNG